MLFNIKFKPRISIRISFLMLLYSCSFNSPNEIDSRSDIYNYFNSFPKVLKFENSSLFYGEALSDSIKQMLMFGNADNNRQYHAKGAFELKGLQNTTFFIYGVSDKMKNEMKEIRIRSFRGENLIDDNKILNIQNDIAENYIYYPTFLIKTIKTNESGKQNIGYYKALEDGTLENLSMLPDSTFEDLNSSSLKQLDLVGTRLNIFN